MKKGGTFPKKTIADVPLRGKTILLRADYNVPLTPEGAVADDYRIRSSIPTVKKLLAQGCKIVIISHLGRPDGKKDMSFTLEPAAQRLAELLEEPVRFVNDCIGQRVKMAVKRAPKCGVTVLENLRFYAGEEENDEAFARQLAEDSGAEYFVQDGFGVVHRAHASTAAITMFLPSVAGLLLEREYVTITTAMKHPARPLVAVMGGAKVSDKIAVIEAMIPVADTIIISGAMANTFLNYQGVKLGKSKVEDGQTGIIKKIYETAERKVGHEAVDSFLVLPVDLGVGMSLDSTATRQDVPVHNVSREAMALDIGPKSVEQMVNIVAGAKTVIWNGDLGVAEIPAFARGSTALASALAENPGCVSIIGGGDTADFVIHWDPKHGDSFTHVSTGGGASLELMSGLRLPGIECLLDAS